MNPDASDSEPARVPPERRTGLDVAREALAAAKAEAKRRGTAARATGTSGQGGAKPAFARRRGSPDQRSGAHPDERDPQLLESSLDRLLAERGWQTDRAVGSVMGRWALIVGAEVAGHSEPVSFDDGRLVVQADSTAWATELRLLTPTLLGRLADELGAGVVTQVQVLGPRAPSWTKGKLRVRGRGARDTYG